MARNYWTTHWYTDDYNLNAAQLTLKYDTTGSHPGYPLRDWRQDVADGLTIAGYWNWVQVRLLDEQCELDRDSPYNQGT